MLNYEKFSLFIVFKDNGKGFSLEKVMDNPHTGLGIRNIESRLSVINGELKIFRPDKGIRYEIEIKDCYEKHSGIQKKLNGIEVTLAKLPEELFNKFEKKFASKMTERVVYVMLGTIFLAVLFLLATVTEPTAIMAYTQPKSPLPSWNTLSEPTPTKVTRF